MSHETRWRPPVLIRRAPRVLGHRAPRQMFNWKAAGCHRATRIAAGVVEITEATRGESRCLVNHPRLHVLHVRREVPSAGANWNDEIRNYRSHDRQGGARVRHDVGRRRAAGPRACARRLPVLARNRSVATRDAGGCASPSPNATSRPSGSARSSTRSTPTCPSFKDAFDNETAGGPAQQVTAAIPERGVDLIDRHAVDNAIHQLNAEQLAH
jgi:hypothetical protein